MMKPVTVLFMLISVDGHPAHHDLLHNCIGAFSVPDRRNIPNVEIKMGTRKGVAVSYSPERIAI